MIGLKKNALIVFLIVLAGCGGPGQAGPPPPQPPPQQQPPAQSQEPPSLPTAVLPEEQPAPTPVPTAVVANNSVEEPAPAAAVEAVSNTEAGVVTTGSSIVPTGCPADHFIDVQTHPANTAYPAPQVQVTCNNTTFVVQSNGIPNFEFVRTTPNDLAAQTYTWEMPLQPQPAAVPSDVPLGGPVAVAVNGIPIFGPTESPQDDYADPYLDGLLDYCNGHTAQRGDYHYHARPDCIFAHFNGQVDGQVGLVMAYAFDGYPILAPYLCQDEACTSVKEVRSSWQRTQDLRNSWDAHQYVAGSGDLDQCNGQTFADGSYAYFATDTFPYFIGCYHGVANRSGPGGGGPPPDQGQNGQQQGPPQGDNDGQGGQPDMAAAAAQLGITEQQLQTALGPPPPDLAAAAQTLGISEDELRRALQATQ